MTLAIARRTDAALFAALALALGFGLLAAPAFDPLEILSQHRVLFWLAGCLHAALGWWGGELALASLGRRFHPAWNGTATRWALGVALLVALAWWWMSLQAPSSHLADGRPLLWLELQPLMLWPAGLLARRSVIDEPVFTTLEQGQHHCHDTRMMNQVDVRRGGHMADPRIGKAGAGRRKDDVVTVTEAAHEQATA